ncbi:hypothetical protein KKC83_03900 [Patescibacteria group bacterium]|nr:FkbM family methyltransferase [Candidatus Falkowbacteria bacterium]MBU3906164.1 hypothetical protein [Patescibacteria group bacterium]MCG2697506.1 hypothetical protein [Candidatus Parcubacteria bacterium]MBU4014984.1 hypothetical protein [Patescibacteria group bacterium]MBU4026657.1 hypothetical protein [Patescibacteria group bacterium]
MKIIEKILSRQEFKNNPPVLLDIGASGKIYEPWREIAKYSICIAFDADEREMKEITIKSGYKKLYIYNKIVSTDNDNKEAKFYLTKSPFCSSLLEPDQKSLDDWNISNLFNITKTVELKTTNLLDALKELGIKQIDWFKTDSQGTDLRIFHSLGDEIINKIIIADFEPGLISAYKNEDKLFHLLSYMEKLPFWINELNLPQAIRINKKIKETILDKKIGYNSDKILNLVLKSSPAWGEVSFINSFKDGSEFSSRDYLLGIALSCAKKQFGFSLELADGGEKKFNDLFFTEIKNDILNEIEVKIERLKFKMPIYRIFRIIKNLIR